MSVSADAAKLSVRTKVAFGIGTMAEYILLTSVGSYAIFYYNQVLGLPATLAGLALTASIIVDGLADPFIGSVSDRTRSRWGRRHPFMFFAPIPVAICLIAIFHPPHGLAAPWLFAWFLGFIVSLKVLSSIYHVPHLAMGGELSTGFTERSRVMAYSIVAATTGAAGTSFVALTYFFKATPEYPRGLMNPDAYGPFALTAAAVVLLIHFCSAWFTRDRIPLMATPPLGGPRFTGFEFLKDIGRALANRNYMFLLIAVFFFSLMTSVRSGLTLYLMTFFWSLSSEQIRWLAPAAFVGGILSFFIAVALHKRIGKRSTMAICAALTGLIPAIPTTLRLLHLMPADGSPLLLAILIVSAGIAACTSSVVGITALSAIGDIADENELRYGIRQEGVLYATRTVFAKLDTALGLFFVGMLLDLMHFPRGAAPGSIDPQTIAALGLFDGPLVVIPALIAAAFYGRFAITKSRHQETRRLIDAAKSPATTVDGATETVP